MLKSDFEVSRRIQLLAGGLATAFLVWMAVGHLAHGRDDRRLAGLDAEIARAEVEIQEGGIQTAVFALG